VTSNFGPFSDGTITFSVGDATDSWITDETTGNYIPGSSHTVTLEYEVTVNLSPASNNDPPGVDIPRYNCDGRLLSPTTFDSRVRIGMSAAAKLCGVDGRLILADIGLSTDPDYRSTLRQRFSGTFEYVGTGSTTN